MKASTVQKNLYFLIVCIKYSLGKKFETLCFDHFYRENSKTSIIGESFEIFSPRDFQYLRVQKDTKIMFVHEAAEDETSGHSNLQYFVKCPFPLNHRLCLSGHKSYNIVFDTEQEFVMAVHDNFIQNDLKYQFLRMEKLNGTDEFKIRIENHNQYLKLDLVKNQFYDNIHFKAIITSEAEIATCFKEKN